MWPTATPPSLSYTKRKLRRKPPPDVSRASTVDISPFLVAHRGPAEPRCREWPPSADREAIPAPSPAHPGRSGSGSSCGGGRRTGRGAAAGGVSHSRSDRGTPADTGVTAGRSTGRLPPGRTARRTAPPPRCRHDKARSRGHGA